MSKLKRHSKAIAIVAASVLALGTLTTGGAVAAAKVGAKDIRSDAVRSSHLKDGTVKKRDLAEGVQEKLDRTSKPGAKGPKGDKGDKGDPASDIKGGLGANFGGYATIDKIGGRFAENRTEVGTFELAPGTYLINGYAMFDRVDDSDGSSPVLQLAIRGADGSEYGTAFTGEFPAKGNLEQTASVTKVITVTKKTEIKVYGFGYNADQSAKGSGNYTVYAQVSAVRVG